MMLEKEMQYFDLRENFKRKKDRNERHPKHHH